jgi:hypothetical protein
LDRRKTAQEVRFSPPGSKAAAWKKINIFGRSLIWIVEEPPLFVSLPRFQGGSLEKMNIFGRSLIWIVEKPQT